ncbi:MAG TPA: 16S rRNA (cytosine(1402)-N(4))-methyltransferase RsmH [Candidatus Babeliales bacterium]|nr:16S rRNA (cytosine(1402)-N(4))-methyltransferase RsmH [Candidatus Babeliales bacterium]
MSELKNEHIPVLIQEVLDCLAPKPGQSYLDLTAGYGGHATSILEVTKSPEKTVLVDRDENATRFLKDKFQELGVKIIRSDFLSTLEKLAGESQKFDIILADLGVSSPHLRQAERGFSFGQPGPLDMRMDQTQTLDADYIVNHLSEAELADILYKYGEEQKSRSVAKEIVKHRPIKNTEHLATTIANAIGLRGRLGKIHPATKSFQAIRIAVNDELAQLEKGLPLMLELLTPDGRMALISFHSLEDRLVKRFFAQRAGPRYDSELTLLTKRPITAAPSEIVSNPRARSAKLRAAAKNKHQ